MNAGMLLLHSLIPTLTCSIIIGILLVFPRKICCNFPRRRWNKMELVNIQELSMEPPQLESLVQTVNQYSGRNFLRLLDIYRQGNRCFLVWEPVELSLNEVLASRCAITETGLAEIVWPVNPPYLPSVIVTFPVNVNNADYLQVLKGIRYLRDHGRALASLDPTKVLLPETGGVRIDN